MNSRCYLRGKSVLGIFNTIIGCIFNRVLVLKVDRDTKKIVGWYWDIATNHPKDS